MPDRVQSQCSIFSRPREPDKSPRTSSALTYPHPPLALFLHCAFMKITSYRGILARFRIPISLSREDSLVGSRKRLYFRSNRIFLWRRGLQPVGRRKKKNGSPRLPPTVGIVH
jgi:hypothetical protein